jgi:hypothetical protein
MSTEILILLSIGILTLLILLLVAVYAARRGEARRSITQLDLDPADETRIMIYLNDGIAEIYAGLLILMAGLFLFSDLFFLAGAFVAVFVPLYISSKRTYTAPRLHMLDDRSARKDFSGFTALLAGTFAVGLLVVIMGVSVYSAIQAGILSERVGELISDYAWILAGAIPAGMCIMAGMMTGIRRFYGYAILSFTVLGLGLLSGIPLPILVCIVGGIVFAVGLVIFYQFVTRFPLPLRR